MEALGLPQISSENLLNYSPSNWSQWSTWFLDYSQFQFGSLAVGKLRKIGGKKSNEYREGISQKDQDNKYFDIGFTPLVLRLRCLQMSEVLSFESA
jgi:hypothetical protein